MSKRIIVTGGAGFIGSHLCDKLIELGHEVFVIDNLRSGKKSNIEHLLNNSKFYFELTDILSDKTNAIFKMMKPDYVFHLAAIPSVQYSVTNPFETNEVNVQATVKMLELSKKNKVKRLIFSSSSSVYGNTDDGPIKESNSCNPLSPYALQKKISEDYCLLYSKLYNLDTVSLRYFNVFGPRQDGDSPYSGVISRFISSIKNGTVPEIHGDGTQSRDFCFINNVVFANLLSMEYSGSLSGQVFNIGSGKPTTINCLHAMLDTAPATYHPKRDGDIQHSYADTGLAESVLGYKVLTPLEDGLGKII